MTVAYSKVDICGRKVRETWSQSATGTVNTVAAGDTSLDDRSKGRPRTLELVTVHYSGNVTQNVTVTLDSVLGSAYDVVLATIPLTAAQDGSWLPEKPVPLMPGDVISASAPDGGGGETSGLIVTTELEEV